MDDILSVSSEPIDSSLHEFLDFGISADVTIPIIDARPLGVSQVSMTVECSTLTSVTQSGLPKAVWKS
jgi:hypothetical protein